MGATQTQELRTRLVWDTRDAEAGEKRVQKAIARLAAAEEKTRKPRGGGHGSGGNFSMMIRDLAEGRIINATARLTAMARAGGFAAAGIFGIVKAYRSVSEAADESAKKTTQLEASFRGLDRTVKTSFASEALGSANDQQRDLRSQLGETNAATFEKGEAEGGVLGFGARAKSRLTAWFNNPMAGPMGAMDAEQATLESQRKLSVAQNAKRFEKYGEALGDDYSIAAEKGPGGNEVQAQLRALEIREKEALAIARGHEASEDQLKTISATYKVLRDTVNAQETIAIQRNIAAKDELAIQGSGKSASAKKIATAEQRRAASRGLLDSGLLTYQQRRAEELNLAAAENEQKGALAERYLNPDGSRRRARDINKDFRDDRKSERRRNRFLRRYDKGGFDPETGRRRATRVGRSSTGLDSDGLESSGLRAGGLAATNWENTFKPAPGTGTAAQDYSMMIYEAMTSGQGIKVQGMPKEVR